MREEPRMENREEISLSQAIRENRVMDAVLSHDFLARLFAGEGIVGIRKDLPEDVAVTGVYADWARCCVIVRLASPRFERVYEGAHPPTMTNVDEFSIQKVGVSVG